MTLTIVSIVTLYIHYRMYRDDPNLAIENIIQKEMEKSSSTSRSERKYVTWTSTEVRRVKTSHGDLYVTVKQSADTCRRHFVTYHDVASDPSVCFDAMFAHMDDTLGLRVHHIHAPGHFSGAKDKPYKYPSIKDLADQVQEALIEMKTGPVIFVGVGAGARILTRVAIETPDLVRGLVLISPTFREAGIWEKMYNVSLQNFTSMLQSLILTRHFNQNVSKEIVQQIQDALRNVDSSLIVKFWDTFTKRKKLDDFDIASLREYYVLLVVGHNKAFSYSGPNYFSDALELRKRLNPRRTTMIQFDRSGSMVSEEIPRKLATNVDAFIAAFA